MTMYTITLINNEHLTENVQSIVNYLGIDNCFSTLYNFYNKYNLKTRNISFVDYYPRAIDKKINSIFENALTKHLADDIIKSSFNIIEAKLNIIQITYLKTLDFIEDIKESPKLEITSISSLVSDNTKISFVSNSPNTNNGLHAQNKDFENYTLDNTKIFNYQESPENTTYKYNTDDPDIECDIIVIDYGVHGGHENFIINGENICRIDKQPLLPWRLSKLYSFIGRKFIPGDTPEGVAIEDPNFHSYFTPPATPWNTFFYNHGTHVAGIICGNKTGWIRSNKVNLYSIPMLLFYNNLITILIELSILEFQLNKIKNNIKIPTLVNRSYGSNITNNNLLNFSNFTKIYNAPWFSTTIINNQLQFMVNQSLYIYPFLLEIQKKFGIVNVFSGGNDTELQLKWSDNPDNYFNYFIKDDNDNNVYPYLPIFICLKEDLWTIGGTRLSDITYNSTLNINIEINFSLINDILNDNPKNIHKILSKNPPTLIVGSLGIMNQNVFNFLQNQNVGFLSNYILSGFSSFGDELIYASGSNIRSSIAYNDKDELVNNYYNNYQGTSQACPNITGILAKYLTRQYSAFTIDVEKIFMNTNKYIQYYIDDNLRNVYKNLDINKYEYRNSYFYIGLARNNLDNINQIYPLNLGSQNEIYCPVLFYNKDYEITQNIPRQLGTFTFDNITYDGDECTFGTIRTKTFSKEPYVFTLGNYRLEIN